MDCEREWAWVWTSTCLQTQKKKIFLIKFRQRTGGQHLGLIHIEVKFKFKLKFNQNNNSIEPRRLEERFNQISHSKIVRKEASSGVIKIDIWPKRIWTKLVHHPKQIIIVIRIRTNSFIYSLTIGPGPLSYRQTKNQKNNENR